MFQAAKADYNFPATGMQQEKHHVFWHSQKPRGKKWEAEKSGSFF